MADVKDRSELGGRWVKGEGKGLRLGRCPSKLSEWRGWGVRERKLRDSPAGPRQSRKEAQTGPPVHRAHWRVFGRNVLCSPSGTQESGEQSIYQYTVDKGDNLEGESTDVILFI